MAHLSNFKLKTVSTISGGRGERSPPPPPPYVFNAEKHFYGMYLALPVKSATSERFCPETNHELHKKHHEAGPLEQLTTDALSQIDYGNTRHCEDCKEFCWCQEKTQRTFWKICVGVCAWLGGRWASRTFQKAPPPLVSTKCRIYLINQLLDNKPDKSSLGVHWLYWRFRAIT